MSMPADQEADRPMRPITCCVHVGALSVLARARGNWTSECAGGFIRVELRLNDILGP